MEPFLDMLDLILRPLGWLIAVGLAIGVITTAAAFCMLPAGHFARGRFGMIAGGALGIVLFIPVTYVFWRIARFAGGYIGSSEYPLHHVVRLILG